MHKLVRRRFADTGNPPGGYKALWRECKAGFNRLEIIYEGFYKSFRTAFQYFALKAPRPRPAEPPPKKNVEAALAALAAEGGAEIAVLFKDKGRFGTRTITGKVLARKGLPVRAKVALGYLAEHPLASLEPLTGRKVLTRSANCDTEAFGRHLKTVSARFTGKWLLAAAADGAGWHTSKCL